MVTLFVVAAGYCLIFGAKDAAWRLVRAAAGLVLVLSFLPGMIAQCSGAADETTIGNPNLDLAWLEPIWVILVLSLTGYVLWKLKPSHERRRQLRAQRDGRPRERAVPPPPPVEDDDEEW